jgi:hypothetical protein
MKAMSLSKLLKLMVGLLLCAALVYGLRNRYGGCGAHPIINSDKEAVAVARKYLPNLLLRFSKEDPSLSLEGISLSLTECTDCYLIEREGAVLQSPPWHVEFRHRASSGKAYAAFVLLGRCSNLMDSGNMVIN